MAYKDRPVWFWIAVAAVAAMVVGSFGPWAKVLGISVNGTDGSNDGWLVVACAALAAVALFFYARSRARKLAILNILLGAAGGAITIYDRHDITTSDADTGLVQVGWGLNLALAGSVALAIASAALVARVRIHTPPGTDAPPTSPEAPPPEQGTPPSQAVDG
jgi:hypothetical protein